MEDELEELELEESPHKARKRKNREAASKLIEQALAGSAQAAGVASPEQSVLASSPTMPDAPPLGSLAGPMVGLNLEGMNLGPTGGGFSLGQGVNQDLYNTVANSGGKNYKGDSGGRGRGGNENTARDWIIQKESSGKTTAQNPTSSAFGLGQLIIANRRAYGKKLGIDPGTTDHNEQLALMDEYVKERYGSYAQAKKFWEKNNWY